MVGIAPAVGITIIALMVSIAITVAGILIMGSLFMNRPRNVLDCYCTFYLTRVRILI